MLWKLPENTCWNERVFIAVRMRKHENYARDTIDGLNLPQQSLLLKSTNAHRRWIKNIVQHNHNYDDDDGDGDDDNQAVRPLCTSLALSAVCFCENQTDLDNYNFMQISLVLVSSFAPSTHFFPRHNFGGKPSNCYALVDKMSAIPHIDCKFFGITFCIHYYHHYQKNLLHGPFFLAIYPP